MEAVARGRRRVLLVMATGTGKTFTVFQIIWRLWKAGKVRRVLFLVDRNILADQTMTNDFKPFGPVMTKVRDRNMDPSYEVYLALYQAVSGSEEEKNVYKQFSRGFFDLVVIDECHRGSAREDSAWREILDYFEPAIQLGLTATPKETSEVSTLTYFGEPVYTYTLKQGIEDGFLAPWKVVRIDLDKDLQGWRPPAGMTDDLGREIEDRVYNQRDMDRVLVLNERTRRVAEKWRRISLGDRPLRQDHRLLRDHRPCGADAFGARQRDRETHAGGSRQHLEVRRAHHGRQRRGQAGARRLRPPRTALPLHRHHVEAVDDRRGRQDLQAHRAGPAHRIDDRVQADRGARRPHPRRRGQALVHRHGLQEGHRIVRRSGLRRGAGRRPRARRRRAALPARR